MVSPVALLLLPRPSGDEKPSHLLGLAARLAALLLELPPATHWSYDKESHAHISNEQTMIVVEHR